MDVRFEVDYIPQLGEGASRAIRDCGPACLAMLLKFRGFDTSVDLICDYLGIIGNSPGANIHQLREASRSYGVRLMHISGVTTDALAETLHMYNNPAIALIRYHHLPFRFDRDYRGGHYVLIVGSVGGSVIIHDPYWPDNRGAYIQVPHFHFEQAWMADGTDFRVSGQLLVVA